MAFMYVDAIATFYDNGIYEEYNIEAVILSNI